MAYIANTAHKPDLGGKVPGTNSPDATDVIQEGLLLPALRLYRGGEVNEDVKTIIMANTRTPEITWGDIQAQALTNFYGLRKLAELMDQYGSAEVTACWDQWMDICEVGGPQGHREDRRRRLRSPAWTSSTTTGWTRSAPIASRRPCGWPAMSCTSPWSRRSRPAVPSTSGPASSGASSTASWWRCCARTCR